MSLSSPKTVDVNMVHGWARSLCACERVISQWAVYATTSRRGSAASSHLRAIRTISKIKD